MEPKQSKENALFEWYDSLVFALAVIVLFFVFAVRIITVSGVSMQPTLYGGDRVAVQSMLYTPQRGDVVVVDGYINYGDPLVKRIIALGGDTVDINFETGAVTLNGAVLEEPYISAPTTTGYDVEFPVTVPEGCVFVMGDNRPRSLDGRSTEVGFIDERDILGKVLLLMENDIRNVDAVLQLLDARIPRSSLNPEIARITAGKPHLYVLNKADLADPDVTARWVAYFRRGGDGCLAITSKNRGGVQGVKNAIETELAELLERRAVKGMAGAKIRVMVVGIPNVGKSTFINSFAGAARAKAADRPGVTRGKQWVTVGNYDLLDVPGVLWKKFDSMEVAGNLAFIGSIKDDVLDIEALATALLGEMQRMYPERLAERYRLTAEELGQDAYDLLETVGRKRGMLMSGGVVNTERAAITLVDEFRGAKLGRVSLERPEEA